MKHRDLLSGLHKHSGRDSHNRKYKKVNAWSDISFIEETQNWFWINKLTQRQTALHKAAKPSSTFPSCSPSLSGVWMQGGGLAGSQQVLSYRGVCVCRVGLVTWHSYIPERVEQPQTAGREPADQLPCERFSLPSSQNNWWWPTRWPFNLLSSLRAVKSQSELGSLFMLFEPRLLAALCYIKGLLADRYCCHSIFLS